MDLIQIAEQDKKELRERPQICMAVKFYNKYKAYAREHNFLKEYEMYFSEKIETLKVYDDNKKLLFGRREQSY